VILRPTNYPFKRIGPGKHGRRNPRTFFNRFEGGDGNFITQVEIFGDLGFEEILPKGKERDPLDLFNRSNTERNGLLFGGGGKGGIPSERFSEGRNEKASELGGLGDLLEKEFNELGLPFYSGVNTDSRHDGLTGRISFPEGYAYGNLETTSGSGSGGIHFSIIEGSSQRAEENHRIEQTQSNGNSTTIQPSNHQIPPDYLTFPLAHQLEIAIGLDRAERIWATQKRKERLEELLRSKKKESWGMSEEEEYQRDFWRQFANGMDGIDERLPKGGNFLEVNQDGGRKVRGLKEGTEKGKGKNGVGRRKGGIQWGS